MRVEEDHRNVVAGTESVELKAGLAAWVQYIRARQVHSWRVVGLWVLVLVLLSAAALLLSTCPAYAQAEGIDTCRAGNVGGEGGQRILNGIKNLALFAAATVGGLSVLGLIISAAVVILGSASKDWQRRGVSGLAYAGLGVFVALGATAIYGVINWAICG